MSSVDRLVSEHGRALGITGTGRRLVDPTEAQKAIREKRKAERKAAREKKNAPILGDGAEVEDTDIEEAIASIQSVPVKVTKSEEDDVMASILASMQGRQP